MAVWDNLTLVPDANDPINPAGFINYHKEETIYGQKFTFNAGNVNKGDKFVIDKDVFPADPLQPVSNSYHPTVTALADGSFVAVWDNLTLVPDANDPINPAGFINYHKEETIYGQKFTFNAGNVNKGDKFVIDKDVFPADPLQPVSNSYHPTVAALADGSFVAVWDNLTLVPDANDPINPAGFINYHKEETIYGKVFDFSIPILPNFGTAGADNLVGNNDNNTFVGGPGNDNINGGTGNDNYAFSAGDGFDTIKDSGGSDTLKLGGGLTPDDLTFSQIGRDLVIDIASGVTIVDQFSGNPGTIVEFASFDDGTVIELPSATNKVTGTAGRDILNGTPANDVISSLGGSIDRMNGGDGADIFVIGAEAVNGVRERDIISDYEVGIDSILLEDGATVGSIRQSSSGVTVFLEGDQDAIYVQGDGVLVGNLTFVPEDIVI